MKKYLIATSILLIVCIFVGCAKVEDVDDVNVEEIEYRFNDIAEGKAYLLENAKIITMENSEDIVDGSILIENGVITKIGNLTESDLPIEYTHIDCEGKYILPGLSDMHVHLYETQAYQRFLAYGVTLVRNMKGSDIHLKRKESVLSGKLLGPEVFVGTNIVDGPNPIWDDSEIIKYVEEIEPFVDKSMQEGYDFIKIYDKLQREIFDELMIVSKRKGIPVAGHIPVQVGSNHASESGLLSSEHLFGHGIGIYNDEKMDESMLNIINKGMYVCPTPLIYENNKDITQKYNINLSQVKHYVSRFNELGGKLVMGTDESSSIILAGSSLHETLVFFVDSGLTPFEALQTATIFPAEMMQIDERLGTISVNKDADLIILEKNPLEDIKNISSIFGVFTKGRYLDKEWITQKQGIKY